MQSNDLRVEIWSVGSAEHVVMVVFYEVGDVRQLLPLHLLIVLLALGYLARHLVQVALVLSMPIARSVAYY